MPTKVRTTQSAAVSEDDQQLTAAKASREALAAAQALATNRQADHDNAEMHEAEMEGQFNQGDDSATASDWSHVQAEVTRTEMLHNAAQTAEKRAENAVVNTDVTLSLIAKEWVQEALKGVDVIASFYVPKTSPDKAVAYVIQRKQTDDLRGGSVAGRVEVRYYRPSLYGALDAGDIQAAAERAHCRVVAASSGSHEYGDGMKVDAIQVDIQRGQSPTPLIKNDPTDVMVSSRVAHAFGADLAAHCRATTDPPVRGVNGEYVGAAITVKPLSGKVTSVDVDGAGVRTAKVQLNLNYHRESDLRTVNVDKHLKELMIDWKGSFVPNFGKVTSITGHLGLPDRLLPPSMPVTVEIVFTSRVR